MVNICVLEEEEKRAQKRLLCIFEREKMVALAASNKKVQKRCPFKKQKNGYMNSTIKISDCSVPMRRMKKSSTNFLLDYIGAVAVQRTKYIVAAMQL